MLGVMTLWGAGLRVVVTSSTAPSHGLPPPGGG
jgi:hypothetical protein